jgi:S-DNA-T family DNA segregation ATPase FtsK/SpoIIIE
LLQAFGYASFILPFYIVVNLFFKSDKSSGFIIEILRFLSLSIAMFFACASLAGIASNNLPSYAGGFFGQIIYNYTIKYYNINYRLILSFISILLLIFSTNILSFIIKIISHFFNRFKSDKSLNFESKKPKVIIKKRQAPIISEENSEDIESSNFILPSHDLFGYHSNKNSIKLDSKQQLEENKQELMQVLQDFGIKGDIIGINQGPVVTLYELEPAAGTKASRIIGLADDIARSLSALSTRISAVPGRNILGIEIPNKQRNFFGLRELLETPEYQNSELNLPIILGRDISGKPYIIELNKLPHLLVAGTTGSGKSVAINVMILSLLYRYTPKECKFIMIDPKMLELSIYDNIPHLLTPVVVDPKKAITALKWAVKEMENRYKLMSAAGVRNIAGYNAKVIEAIKKGDTLHKKTQVGFNQENGEPIYESVKIQTEVLPFIVIIVDEMADLMLVAGKDIEAYIQRLAQMARAAGLHLIMATQRPSVDVITGVIKANFPSRVSFKVTSKIDSRTILSEVGAEQLLGMGDMLYMGSGAKITRVHCPFVQDQEVEKVATYLKSQASPEYITQDIEAEADDEELFNSSDDGSDEIIYRRAIEIVKKDKKPSISYVQRSLRIGYNRAAILIERMEKEGIISPPNTSGKREIL